MAALLVVFAACSGDDGDAPEQASDSTASSTTTTTAAPEYEPMYEEADCPDGVPDDPRVTCGVLTVPENRAAPEGAQVRIPVATVAPPGGDPPTAPDPIVFLDGGPGLPGLRQVQLFLDVDFGGGRNMITFDQRGTGASEPSLDCPETHAFTFAAVGTPNSTEEEEAAGREAQLECRARLIDSGVNLDMYDTTTNAQDVADLRVAMGIDEWNLFGVSYGTQLGLEVMRSHPTGIRAAILDSVTPPHLSSVFDEVSFVERFDRVLNLLAERCGEDPGCAAEYPDPLGEFQRMVERYEAEPFRGTVTNPLTGEPLDVVVTGQDIVAGAFQAYYDSSLIPLLPSLTRQLLNGDTSIIPPLVQRSIDEPVLRHAEAMGISVNCADEAAVLDPDQEDEIASLIEERPLWAGFIGDGAEICEAWDVEPAPEGFNEPVTSDVRTLVLAGEFDPVTPPEMSRSAADHLGDAAYVEFPGLGHGEVFAHDCPRQIFRAFIDDPDAPVDTSCVAEMGPPDFVVP